MRDCQMRRFKKIPLGKDAINGSPSIYAHECRIRDAYAVDIARQRPHERIVTRETRYQSTALRADLRTVDRTNLLREWEFKIKADHHALGQVLTYIAHARHDLQFRPIRGVIAAFSFTDELRRAIEVMNLNIELVTIPAWMGRAGEIPLQTFNTQIVAPPIIPSAQLLLYTNKKEENE